jgi:hypothetical protein
VRNDEGEREVTSDERGAEEMHTRCVPLPCERTQFGKSSLLENMSWRNNRTIVKRKQVEKENESSRGTINEMHRRVEK